MDNPADLEAQATQFEDEAAVLEQAGRNLAAQGKLQRAKFLRDRALLLQQTQGLLPNVQEHFRRLLIQSHISNPRQEVLDMIARRLPSHMIVCNSTDAAVDLYQHAKLMPGVSTKGHLITQHGVRVTGPLFPRDTDGSPSLLVGSDATGCPCIVKLLAGPSRLGDTRHPPGIYAALKMPHYCGSVASQLQLPEDAVVRGGIRMQSALSHIHSLGLVHMDVKLGMAAHCYAEK
ncbi:hypothetical protein WJX84_011842 [Apatococcus fuscideae]|uniref:Protein kinase domain-containing protein n=1 Tax=Apatococcus fuscideae TaxID=2026836 RepID=A0AAW1TCC1_9CHLO